MSTRYSIYRRIKSEVLNLVEEELEISFAFAVLFTFGCQEDLVPREEFTVKIESTSDISCGLPVILFLDKKDQVKAKTNEESLGYNVYGLDESLNVIGNELLITFGKVRDEDFRVCRTIGTPYPAVLILSARLRD